MKTLPLSAVTAGEPAGIGPDLCVALAAYSLPARVVIVADRNLLAERAAALGVACEMREFLAAPSPAGEHGLVVRHVDLAAPARAGRLDPVNSRYVLETLKVALEGCLDGTFDAMATAPVHKGVINDAGIPFTGHTEFLAERSGADSVVMMLAGGGMRVALATTHVAVKDVPRTLTRASLRKTLRTLHDDLVRRFGIARPRVLVSGLNPHAGEGGHLGREEIDVIIPVLEELRAEDCDLVGPLPADTLFQPDRLQQCDCVFTMFHDQGLPVLKYASFGSAVNVTLGLPIIRTSVDHGTALELAGTGKAHIGSLLAAIELAAELASTEKSNRTAHPR